MLMSARPPLAELEDADAFVARHIGPDADEQRHMLSVIGAASRQALIDAIVPRSIARGAPMQLPAAGERGAGAGRAEDRSQRATRSSRPSSARATTAR